LIQLEEKRQTFQAQLNKVKQYAGTVARGIFSFFVRYSYYLSLIMLYFACLTPQFADILHGIYGKRFNRLAHQKCYSLLHFSYSQCWRDIVGSH
jgi:hypothetical protein